jgi:hypothetical protein
LRAVGRVATQQVPLAINLTFAKNATCMIDPQSKDSGNHHVLNAWKTEHGASEVRILADLMIDVYEDLAAWGRFFCPQNRRSQIDDRLRQSDDPGASLNKTDSH